MEILNVGIIGTGNISDIYISNLQKLFNNIKVVACSSRNITNASKKAEKFSIEKYYSVEDMLNDKDIDLIVNLTTPDAHYEITKKSLLSGKHVYVEKPLSITREEGKEILELSRKLNLKVGGAPDTFLGGGIQTCIKLIDEGYVGEIVGVSSFMLCPGHEDWHPNPEFYYKQGGGPMFDMGPYYLTALISMFGPIENVVGMTKKTHLRRKITSKEKYGDIIEVEVPTHISSFLEFKNGVHGSLITSFDVLDSKLPNIEIYGTKGTIIAPDPNEFGGPIYLKDKSSNEWTKIEINLDYTENSRGLGVYDLANAIIENREPRASLQMMYHVLDVMYSIHESAVEKKYVKIESVCKKPQKFYIL